MGIRRTGIRLGTLSRLVLWLYRSFWPQCGFAFDVTLLDAYGPGNSRASSGGETRVIRMGYGAQEIYTRWSWRSLELWKALFERADAPLFHETGVLWLARDEDTLTDATLATLKHV